MIISAHHFRHSLLVCLAPAGLTDFIDDTGKIFLIIYTFKRVRSDWEGSVGEHQFKVAIALLRHCTLPVYLSSRILFFFSPTRLNILFCFYQFKAENVQVNILSLWCMKFPFHGLWWHWSNFWSQTAGNKAYMTHTTSCKILLISPNM